MTPEPPAHDLGELAAISVRFWSKVVKTEGCWYWTGGKNESGYGRFWTGEAVVQAHRWSWEQANGPIPVGLLALHHCDNPACVRPEHLFVGTQVDNMRDAAAKGRNTMQRTPEVLSGDRHWTRRLPRERRAVGERHGSAKLTLEQVEAIRTEYVAGGTSHLKLAGKYGVSERLIQKIVNRELWNAEPAALRPFYGGGA